MIKKRSEKNKNIKRNFAKHQVTKKSMVQYILLTYCTIPFTRLILIGLKNLFADIMIFSGIVKEIDIDITT